MQPTEMSTANGPEPMAPQPSPVPMAPMYTGRNPRSGNNALVAVLIVILAIATVGNGALFMQSNSKLNTTNSDLAAAQSNNTSLQSSIAQQQTAANGLSSSVAAIQQTVSKLTGTTTPAPPSTTDYVAPAK